MVPKLTSFVALSALCVGSTVANVQYGGINIAGFDFGIDTTGSGSASQAYPPLKAISGIDGVGQMQHFVTDDKFNAFRLPVGWQYLVNDQVGPIDPSNLATYDQLVQGCLQTGALCIIDIHNYARFNGGIIGQGGPSNEQFADFWGSLATKYASQDQVAFGLMNEPHDLNVDEWTQSVQAAVTAIRGAGANNNMVLMPSTSYTSAATLVSSGCAASLNGVTNPDGSKTNLVFDVHRYFDGDGSGTSTDCVSANIADFQSVADFMHANNRQAFVTEIGGGSTPSCIPIVSQVIDFLNNHSDVYLGFTSWAAGSFATNYNLAETPTGSTDTPIVAQAIEPAFDGGSGVTTAESSESSATTTGASRSTAATSTAAAASSLLSSPSASSSSGPSSTAPTSGASPITPQTAPSAIAGAVDAAGSSGGSSDTGGASGGNSTGAGASSPSASAEAASGSSTPIASMTAGSDSRTGTGASNAPAPTPTGDIPGDGGCDVEWVTVPEEEPSPTPTVAAEMRRVMIRGAGRFD